MSYLHGIKLLNKINNINIRLIFLIPSANKINSNILNNNQIEDQDQQKEIKLKKEEENDEEEIEIISEKKDKKKIKLH